MKRRKILGAIAIIIATSFSVNAQSNDSNAEFGVKGGVNFSNMYTEDVDDNNVLTSFNAGLYVKLPITDMIAIQPELLYSRKGAELSYNNLFATGTAKFKLNYIELPVLLKLNLTDNFNIHAGPYLAYLVNAQVTNENDNGSLDFENTLDNEDFNKFDYGVSGGIGFDFDSFSIGARYNYGLQTVGKEQSIGGFTYTVPNGKNSNLSLYASIKL